MEHGTERDEIWNTDLKNEIWNTEERNKIWNMRRKECDLEDRFNLKKKKKRFGTRTKVMRF